MKKQGDFVPSMADLAARLGMGSRQILDDCRRAGLPLKKTAAGYDVAAIKADYMKWRAAVASLPAGASDLKTEKLRLECERLGVGLKIDTEKCSQAELETLRQRGQVIPMSDHRQIMDDIRAMYLSGLDQIIENVSTKARSVQVRDLLQTAVDNLRNRIAALADPTPESAAFLRTLAKDYMKQADAIDARRAGAK
jgi:hypothetical protein